MKRAEAAGYEVYCGIDVGKESHYARALAPDGETELLGRRVPQDERELAALFSELGALGRTLVVVDQHSGFGALVAACAREAGAALACVPPARFARISELSGEGKTDEADALELARLPIEAPRHLEWVPEPDGEADEARVLTRYRDALVAERTRAYNRVHDALNRVCPPLEALLSGSGLHALLALSLLARYGALGLAAARRCDVARWVRSRGGFGPAAEELALAMWEAARSSSAGLPAAAVLDETVRLDCARIIELERLDDRLSERIAGLCALVPEVEVARTMAGVGEVYSRTIALEIGDIGRFPNHSALAAYVGVGKCPRESGHKKGKKKRRSYNRRLHAAMFESAKIAIRAPGPDRDYYVKKLAGEMNEHQALHALVRKRVTIMFAMLANMRPYTAA